MDSKIDKIGESIQFLRNYLNENPSTVEKAASDCLDYLQNENAKWRIFKTVSDSTVLDIMLYYINMFLDRDDYRRIQRKSLIALTLLITKYKSIVVKLFQTGVIWKCVNLLYTGVDYLEMQSLQLLIEVLVSNHNVINPLIRSIYFEIGVMDRVSSFMYDTSDHQDMMMVCSRLLSFIYGIPAPRDHYKLEALIDPVLFILSSTINNDVIF